MNKAMKRRWVRALRSGEYKQGNRRLHREDGSFCCLGVLLDTEVDGDWCLGLDPQVGGMCYYLEDEALGLGVHLDPHGISVKQENVLTTMNDEGQTFDEIADYIEEHL